ncbi:UDP-3-O-(3-hydroxymyristoyl)glucosamine N-acyltransferase [Maribellus sp. YY47]|uniref:UDP-3-O-(3-hydroxymyristoyl)glucosamine N-acyltransferase n=1 Tax=Maribellus sp. YY47 TaxID=2929486 RepID=UPI0020013324|nr:UDP-3-O-(3-hydroxymyristoyl)glucosamine N-acyltransferase [Maribellus sp. YY47]MCK3682633.1 UDP-3-O-(3-hydroxymyristoyl)glucosamine N-acyltransferase [Maribellus sp. YY47]
MEFKATDIASFLGGEIVGDSDVKVNNVSKIEEGKEGTLAFLANPKYEHYIYETKASIVLVNRTFVPNKEISATLIKVDDAYKAFASLLDLYVQATTKVKKGIEQPSFVSEGVPLGEDVYVGAFAYIGQGAVIGNKVQIHPQVHIGENVTIGDNSIIYAGAKIYPGTVIGNRCIVHSGAVIGSDGFGFAPQEDGSYKKIPQIGIAILEDDVEIGANTTVDCGTMGHTIIRKGTKIDNLVQIAHNCDIGEHNVFAGQVGIAGSTKVGNYNKFAGQVGLGGHITVGDHVTLGAQSGVGQSVKSNQVLFGSPAIEIKQAMKAYVALRYLPEMRTDVARLKKDLEALKDK